MESSAPPPGAGGPVPDAPASEGAPARPFALATPGGFKRLLGGAKGEHCLWLSPREIVVAHAGSLRAPLRFAPGSVAVAVTDPGPAAAKSARGRFAILRRLSKTAVVPRSEGIEGWLWTGEEGTAMTILGDDAPNVAFLFTPPLAGPVVQDAFEPTMLEELAKRSPLGEPAVFGLLLRAERLDGLEKELERLSLNSVLTDREVPPVQRRHLPDDKPANPAIVRGDAARSQTSIPPPGFGG